MRVFGLEITTPKRLAKMMTSIAAFNAGWYGIIREPFTGAWQQDVAPQGPREILAFSAVFSSVTIIAGDIAKLCIGVKKRDEDQGGIGVSLTSAEMKRYAVLRKPNHYQNRIQFWLQWIISKLLTGNAYALKVRDAKGNVVKLFVLDPSRVMVLVSTSGDVYYRLARDDLSGVSDPVTVPASEIIHDLMNPLWHPLVGVSPIYACAMSAMMGNKIQQDSTKFFSNMSRPSGMLTSATTIDDVTANRLKLEWEKNFTGGNIGKLAVLGDGLKYEPMTIPANDAQLIEQLKWTVEDVARCFHIPIYKLGGTVPSGMTVQALNQQYYNDCLQSLIESAELALDEGLGFPDGLYTEFEVENLMRMDTAARYEAYDKAIGSFMKPNEARAKEDLPPVIGGDEVYLQQQNYSLKALAKRDAKADPFESSGNQQQGGTKALPPPPKNEDEDEVAMELVQQFVEGLEAERESASA